MPILQFNFHANFAQSLQRQFCFEDFNANFASKHWKRANYVAN